MHRLLVVDSTGRNEPMSVIGVIMEYYSLCEGKFRDEHVQADPRSWVEFIQSQLFSYHNTV